MMRQTKSRIENEITVAPEFRDIFTNKFSLLGSKGRTIKEMRTDHKPKKIQYKKRKQYEVKFD